MEVHCMKKLIIILCVILILALFIPFPATMNDGGTVHYDAILYDVYDVHRFKPVEDPPDAENGEREYIEGMIIKIFGSEVFNNTNPHIDH